MAEIQAILACYIERSKNLQGDNLTLDRMWPVLRVLGDPQKKLKVVHIAGTSGKTSTAYYCAALLQQAGCRVGLTVSPHIDSLFERIQINAQPITKYVFEAAFSTFYELVRTVKSELSYFELLVLFEIWYFAQVNVEYAVIETGMGGLHDATNVLQREDKVCVITDIGFDHMHVLGNTLAKIATQKAGIIHQQNHVFMYEQSDEVMQQVTHRVLAQKATVHVVDLPDGEPSLEARFQIRNASLARSAVSYIAKRDGLHLSNEKVEVVVPARMEQWTLASGDVLLMDGAHNEQKMRAFVDSFVHRYGKEKVPVLVALKKDKQYQRVLDILSQIASFFVLTTFTKSEQLPTESIDPRLLENYIHRTHNGIQVVVYPDCELALKHFLEYKVPLCVATGSFYLLSEIRAMLRQS